MKAFLLLLLVIAATQAEQENIKTRLSNAVSQVGYRYTSASKGNHGDIAVGYSSGVYSNGGFSSRGYRNGASIRTYSRGYSHGKGVPLQLGYGNGGSLQSSSAGNSHGAGLNGGYRSLFTSPGQVEANTIAQQVPVSALVPITINKFIPVAVVIPYTNKVPRSVKLPVPQPVLVTVYRPVSVSMHRPVPLQ